MAKTRWRVEYTMRSMYEGLDPDMPERPRKLGGSEHATFVGADFSRRFRMPNYPTLGARWVETEILDASEPPRGDWPHYKVALDPLWSALYWLRSRWDGIRHGLDRDKRS